MFDTIQQGEDFLKSQHEIINALYEEAKNLQNIITIRERIITHAQNEILLMKDIENAKVIKVDRKE